MAKRGIKSCPNCQKELGARTLLCSCGYSFTFKEVKPELLLEKVKASKEVKYYTEPGQGRKICPACSVIISAVTKTCPKCSFDFSAEKKKKDEEKRLQAEEKQRIRDEKKVSKVVVKVVEEEKKIEISPVQRILQREAQRSTSEDRVTPIVANMSSKEHAERILSYGKERAAFLLDQHKFGNTWSHVDWKEVEAGLGVK